jgi:phosphatidylglycerophosphate synthase
MGEFVDASFDKFGALAVLIAVAFVHIVPWWAVIVIALQNGANTAIAYIGWRHKLAMHPVRSGKISTACLWLAFFCFILAAAYGHVWLWPAYIILVPALWLGVLSTQTYAKELFVAPTAASITASKARRT